MGAFTKFIRRITMTVMTANAFKTLLIAVPGHSEYGSSMGYTGPDGPWLM